MKVNPVNSPSAPKPEGGYSQAVQVTDAKRMLLVSGQIPETVDGEVPDGFDAQARLVWKNVVAQLEAAGMSVANLVKVTIYLSSREYAQPNSDIRREVLGTHVPTLTVIITGIFDEQWLLEIEAMAVE